MKLIDKITLPFYRIRNAFRDVYYNLKYRCQRFVRGYADEDIWNLDIWFVETMKKLLSEFIKRNDGYPADLTEEKWEAILVTMNELLYKMDKDELCKRIYNRELYEIPLEAAREITKEAENNKEEFFRLFSKYFNHLWY
jgi:hypothetical protein